MLVLNSGIFQFYFMLAPIFKTTILIDERGAVEYDLYYVWLHVLVVTETSPTSYQRDTK